VLAIALLLVNQTTFEILLGSLKSQGTSHFLSALLMFPLEIPVLLVAITPELPTLAKVQILSGLLLIASSVLGLTAREHT